MEYPLYVVLLLSTCSCQASIFWWVIGLSQATNQSHFNVDWFNSHPKLCCYYITSEKMGGYFVCFGWGGWVLAGHGQPEELGRVGWAGMAAPGKGGRRVRGGNLAAVDAALQSCRHSGALPHAWAPLFSNDILFPHFQITNSRSSPADLVHILGKVFVSEHARPPGAKGRLFDLVLAPGQQAPFRDSGQGS